jgi:hypothetical protein
MNKKGGLLAYLFWIAVGFAGGIVICNKYACDICTFLK